MLEVEVRRENGPTVSPRQSEQGFSPPKRPAQVLKRRRSVDKDLNEVYSPTIQTPLTRKTAPLLLVNLETIDFLAPDKYPI